MNIIRRIGRRLRKRFSKTEFEVLKLSGTERFSGDPLDVLYAGSESQKPFIKSSFFGDEPVEVPLGRCSPGAVGRVAENNDCQLVACVHPVADCRQLPRNGYVLPLWVTAMADTSRSPLESRNRSLRSDLRLIKRTGLSAEETTSPEDFAFFWERMYLPYTESQYLQQAIFETEEEFHRQVDDGDLRLFFIVHEGRRIAGGAVNTASEIPRFRYLGILDSDPEARKLGVLPALYVNVLDWAWRNGYERLNLGGCRPFLNDGVLQFKKKFNTSLRNGTYKKIIYINILKRTPAIFACLAANPLIRLDGDKLVATYFEHEGQEAQLPDSLWQVGGEKFPGLDRVERIDVA